MVVSKERPGYGKGDILFTGPDHGGSRRYCGAAADGGPDADENLEVRIEPQGPACEVRSNESRRKREEHDGKRLRADAHHDSEVQAEAQEYYGILENVLAGKPNTRFEDRGTREEREYHPHQYREDRSPDEGDE